MQTEFTLSVNQINFHFKRIYHPELPLTYHIHFTDWHQHTVFRMRESQPGHWTILPMHLPPYVTQAEEKFRNAILLNEAEA